jgi:hypothetical protein
MEIEMEDFQYSLRKHPQYKAHSRKMKDHNGEGRLDEMRKSKTLFFPKKCKNKGCFGMTNKYHGLCQRCFLKRKTL